MTKVLFTLVKPMLIVVMAMAVLATVHQLASAAEALITPAKQKWGIIFVSGLLFRLIFRWISRASRKKDPFHFIDTLEHELTHALFGYLTFSPPHSIWASQENEGEVILSRHNVLNVLSPYFFPLWTSLFLILGIFIRNDISEFWNGITIFLFSLFCYRLLTEIRWYQTDLFVYGRIFSLTFIALGFLMAIGVVLHFTQLLPLGWLKGVPAHVWQLLGESFEFFGQMQK